MTKITDDDAEVIFEMLVYAEELREKLRNLSCRNIGKLYGLSGNAVWHIWNGSTHSHLQRHRAREIANKLLEEQK